METGNNKKISFSNYFNKIKTPLYLITKNKIIEKNDPLHFSLIKQLRPQARENKARFNSFKRMDTDFLKSKKNIYQHQIKEGLLRDSTLTFKKHIFYRVLSKLIILILKLAINIAAFILHILRYLSLNSEIFEISDENLTIFEVIYFFLIY